jgi:hypothetical protein
MYNVDSVKEEEKIKKNIKKFVYILNKFYKNGNKVNGNIELNLAAGVIQKSKITEYVDLSMG